ncbi:DMT family transporter [Jannaschia aquimarina]|uniref:EamA-like transporter family protein n=1 Tax=Jannaschia aquimarina TaxID=935700 RepID=A0A0D1EC10_9RHOB|nr:DMT family transporter [Jannaschia aquimarina]KIT15259.1 EamA-like transporter family protein [Jannaschia aquimarina]SNS87610.1 S-adenosylmethionine uptake transporter [Jannaschia aquimarina]
MTENLRGALFMMGSMATFTLNDACIKWLAEGLPTFQVVVLRGLAATALIALLAHLTGALSRPIPAADRAEVAGRSVAEVAAFLPFVLALTHMPLANITAILQALPLTITAAGALLLGERVGWRRWTAIGVGLAGVLLIVRPGAEGFNAWSLLAVLSVIIITARDLITRRLSPEVPSLKVAIFTAGGVTGLGAIVSLGEPWQPVTPGQGALMLLAAGFVFGGYLFSILAMRHGEVAVVTPFRYTAIIWGLLLGVTVFGERPDALTLTGATLVAATGLYTLWRETRAPVPRPVAPR